MQARGTCAASLMGSHCEALIQQLHTGSPAEQHQAVAALSLKPLTSRGWLSAVGAIPCLLQLLHSTSTTDLQARAIQNLLQQHIALSEVYLTEHNEEAPDGVIPPLVVILRQEDENECGVAALILATLAINARNRRKVMEAGAIEDFVRLLEHPLSWDVQFAASRALVNLSLENADSGQARVAAAGAIPPLVHMLQTASREELLIPAAKALTNLASFDAMLVVEAGAVSILVQRLTGSSALAQEFVAYALRTIAKDFGTHAAMLSSAPLLPLVRTLASDSDEAQEHALQALMHLSSHPAFPERFAAAGAMPLLMQMQRFESGLMNRRAMSFYMVMALLNKVPAESAALPAHLQGASSTGGQEGGTPSALPSAASVRHASAAGSNSAVAAALPSAAAAAAQFPSRARKSCWSCSATGVPLKKCSRCSVAAYCGTDCQQADWKAHKGQCAGLKAGAASVPEGMLGT